MCRLREPPPPLLVPPAFTNGVGRELIRANCRCADHFSMEGEFSFPAPVGVGSDKPCALALMRRADMPSSKHTPPSIIPHCGKATEDRSQASTRKVRGVFDKDIARPCLANDSAHLKPEARAITRQTSARSRARDILAREAPADDLHFIEPAFAVEGSDVTPDRKSLQMSFCLPLKQALSAKRVDFDSASGPPPKKFRGKDSPSDAGK